MSHDGMMTVSMRLLLIQLVDLLDRDWRVEVHHTFGEENSCPDQFAVQLQDMLRQDIVGHAPDDSYVIFSLFVTPACNSPKKKKKKDKMMIPSLKLS